MKLKFLLSSLTAVLLGSNALAQFNPVEEGYEYCFQMFNAGIKDPAASSYIEAADAYCLNDCSRNEYCFFVMAEDGYHLSRSEAWFKDYSDSNSEVPPSMTLQFFEDENGNTIAWQGCFPIPPGGDGSSVEIHSNFALIGQTPGNTASTGKKNGRNADTVMLDYDDCSPVPAPVTSPVAPVSSPVVPVTAPVTAPATTPVTSPAAAPIEMPATSSTPPNGFEYCYQQYNAGKTNPTKPNYRQTADVFCMNDCANNQYCFVVVAEDGIFLARNEVWFKDYSNGITSEVPNTTAIEFFEDIDGNTIGWEGCFVVPTGSDGSSVEIHSNWGMIGVDSTAGGTSSTGKRSGPDTSTVSINYTDCSTPFDDPVSPVSAPVVPTVPTSYSPSSVPSSSPSSASAVFSTGLPTTATSSYPSVESSESPTSEPTVPPSGSPSHIPSPSPTEPTTAFPSDIPSTVSSDIQSSTPTRWISPEEVSPPFSLSAPMSASPSAVSSGSPTWGPTLLRSANPTQSPSGSPTKTSTAIPSHTPSTTGAPTERPAYCPSIGSFVGVVVGDPHIYTFDGLSTDCQAEGEFVLLKSKTTTRQIQARFQQVSGAALPLSVTKSVVVQDASDSPVVQINLPVFADSFAPNAINGCSVQFFVDEVQRDLLDGSGHEDKVVVTSSPTQIDVLYIKTGLRVTMTATTGAGVCFMNLQVHTPCDDESLIGLLGTTTGSPLDDWTTSSGAPISLPPVTTGEAAYEYCTANWCIRDPAESMYFHSEPGVSHSTFNFCDMAYGGSVDDLIAGASSEILELCGSDEACIIDGVMGGIEAARATLEARAVISETCNPVGGECRVANCCPGLACSEDGDSSDFTCTEPLQCKVCEGTTSGPCKNLENNVCYELQGDVCPMGTTQCGPDVDEPEPLPDCTSCWGASAGPCKSVFGVCYPLVSGQCALGTTACGHERRRLRGN